MFWISRNYYVTIPTLWSRVVFFVFTFLLYACACLPMRYIKWNGAVNALLQFLCSQCPWWTFQPIFLFFSTVLMALLWGGDETLGNFYGNVSVLGSSMIWLPSFQMGLLPQVVPCWSEDHIIIILLLLSYYCLIWPVKFPSDMFMYCFQATLLKMLPSVFIFWVELIILHLNALSKLLDSAS